MMLLDALLVAMVAIGHFGVMIAILNWSHGLGITSRWMEPVAGLTSLVLGLLSLAGFGAMVWAGSASWPAMVWVYAGVGLGTSLVILPAVTIARGFRRSPAGVRGCSEIVDLARRHGHDALIGRSRRGLVLRLPGSDALRLEVRDWSLPMASLPPELDGLSLLHISDLHFSHAYDRRFFEAVADEAAATEADLVLFTGDLLDDDNCIDWIIPVMGRLRGRLGSFAILGNHDLHHHPDRITADLERAGFRVLDGTWDRLDVDGLPLAIGGTFAPWGPVLDDPAPGAAMRIVLSHTPDRVYELSRRDVDLILSGHNHGGQVRLPVIGPVLMPSLYGRRLEEGLFRVGPSLLHVSRGIGAKHPIRFRCLPEISRLVLRSAAPSMRTPHAATTRRGRVT